MMKTVRFIISAMAVMAAAACEENIYSESTDAQEAEVLVSFRTVPDTPVPIIKSIDPSLGVDEGVSSDYMVADFWLMQYDDAGSMVGSPRYYRMSDYEGTSLTASVVLPPVGAEYTCVVIANTHSDMFYKNMGDVTTLDKLKKSCARITAESDLYQINGSSSKDLMMNGFVILTSESTSLDFDLFRNIAKVTVSLTNKAGSNVNVKSIQVKNVPDVVCYADQLLGGILPCPTSSEARFFDYPIEDVVMEASSSDQTESFTFYLPRNAQGTTASTTAEGKNNGAPSFATFIEVLAEDSINEIPLRYTFYLGANTTNDFNVLPNHEYTFPITISGTGNPELDSRVESLGSVTLSGANSFIVNPLSGTMQPVFQVTTERVNLFWSSVDGDPSMVLDASSEWVVEVIWQDTDKRVIDFCNASGTVIKDGSDPVDRYEGMGINSFYFKTRQQAYNTECNVLLGLRLKSDLTNTVSPQYLWSWHMWITSYDPTPVEEAMPGKYIYPAKNGGEIHRYADALGGIAWSATYAGKFIMDRNLGARTALGTASKELVGGFYYQFGRKDPFPYIMPIYNINGTRIIWNETGDISASVVMRLVNGPTTMATSVNSPYTYYIKPDQRTDGVPAGGDWLAGGYSYSGNQWNNPEWYVESSSGKSFFDPCPKGWKLPDCNIWRIFQEDLAEAKAISNMHSRVASGSYMYVSGWKEGDVVFYPGMSRMHPYYGTYEADNNNIMCWTYFPSGVLSGTHLYITSTWSYYNRTSSRSSGHPVRCIQE